MIAPQLNLYLSLAAFPIGFILSLMLHQKLKATEGKEDTNRFRVVLSGTTLTVVTTMFVTMTVTQIWGVITYPKFDATIVHVSATTRDVKDDDGDIDTRTYYKATYQFTGPDNEIITRQSDQTGTGYIREGDTVRIAYKNGKMFELNGWGYLFLAIFVLASMLSFFFWHALMSALWTQKKTPVQ